jgi:tetratricopeptide (TPR) repeat protein
VRQQRRALTLAWSATGSLVILAGLAGWQWKVAIDNERAAIEQRQLAQQQRDRAERALVEATSAADSLVMDIGLGVVQLAGVPIEVVQSILDRASALQQRLVESGENTPNLRLTKALTIVGQSYPIISQGDIPRAVTMVEEAVAIMDRLVKEEPQNLRLTLLLPGFYDFLAHLYSRDGRREAALEIYQRGLALRRRWAQEDKDNVSHQLALYQSLKNVGSALGNLDRLQDALKAFQDGELILKRVIDLKSDEYTSRQVYEYLADTRHKIGLVMKQWKRVDDAEKYFRDSIASREQLIKFDATRTVYQMDLRASVLALAELLPAKEAFALYQRALAITQTVANADQGNVEKQLYLATSHFDMGNILFDLRREREAAAEYRAAAAIREKIVAANPRDLRGRRELSMTYATLAVVLRAAKQNEEALAAFRRALAINQELAKDDSTNNELQGNLAATYLGVGYTLLEMNRFGEAFEAFLASISVSANQSGADIPNWSNAADARLSQMLDLARRTIALNRLAAHQIGALKQIVQKLEGLRARCRVVGGTWRCG